MSLGELFKELCKDIWNLIDRFLDWFIDDYSKKIYRDFKDFMVFMLFLTVIVAFFMVIYAVIKL